MFLIFYNYKAGFVIKTRKLLGQKEKAFINVYHHEEVELVPFNVPTDRPIDKPYIIIGPLISTKDKSGIFSFLYNVCVSTEYFDHTETAYQYKITSPECVQKV